MTAPSLSITLFSPPRALLFASRAQPTQIGQLGERGLPAPEFDDSALPLPPGPSPLAKRGVSRKLGRGEKQPKTRNLPFYSPSSNFGGRG